MTVKAARCDRRGDTMKLVMTAALASLALAAPADAADLFGSPPPASFPASQAPTAIEIGSNWYLRGDIGASFDDGPTAAVSPALAASAGAAAIPFATTVWGGETTTNFTGGLGFGYRFSDYLRFDATWDYSGGPRVNRSAPFGCGGGATALGLDVPVLCNGSFSLRQHANTFLANAYIDLGSWNGFTPYLGGGIGLGAESTQTSFAYSQSVVGPPAYVVSSWSGAINSTNAYGVAWALMVGLSYQLTPSVLIDLGYRYLNDGPTRTFLNPQTGTTLKQSNVSQQVRIGVRYLIQ